MKLAPKTISGIIALFGVISLIGLEWHISPDQSFAVTAAIIFAGIGRLYMFTEGATMEDDRHQKTAFYTSIVLTLLFACYVLWIWNIEKFDDYLLALFLICTATLLAVEWVFGKRTGYAKKNKIRLREHQSNRLMKIARNMKSTLTEKVVELQQRVGSLESERNGLQQQVNNLKDRLTDLERKGNLTEIALGYFLIDEENNNQKFRVSDCCHAISYLPSNRATSLNCSECGKLIWTKEKITA